MQNKDESYFTGRGAQIKTKNPYLAQEYVTEHIEGLDEELLPEKPLTQVIYTHPKTIVNRVDSPDVGPGWSLNPYQGCEHGCIYCYARNSHQYWGYSAGLDFETKILVKQNAPELLEKLFLKKAWQPETIMVSGNTDCYQPLERKLQLTRRILQVFAKYRHPLGMITKNSLVTRDLDILTDLASDNLARVYFSINTLDEKLRSTLEPRTASAVKKLKAMEKLAKAGVPVGVMNAPVIPGLNHHEIPAVLKASADHGAMGAGYTMVRLNGSIGTVFEDWLRKNFPDRFEKVWHLIYQTHDGQVNDSRYGHRMQGDGPVAEMVKQLFKVSRQKYFGEREMPRPDLSKFRRGGTYRLF